jgi:hypothetical protein
MLTKEISDVEKEMITLLTSELNRINQGCKARIRYQDINLKCGEKVGDIGITFPILCPTCQKEKETLKKVSLMWADKASKWLKENCIMKDGDCHNAIKMRLDMVGRIVELQKIKSLMEKA